MTPFNRQSGIAIVAAVLLGTSLLAACEAVDEEEFEQMEQEFEERQAH
ncbi:MAG: hypothetical protein JJT90_16960 [Ectothiorhodospiraceae bacterium]|nr:hypothetical protein [Ectothiorhodospiraceae bacterium]